MCCIVEYQPDKCSVLCCGKLTCIFQFLDLRIFQINVTDDCCLDNEDGMKTEVPYLFITFYFIFVDVRN